jgi:hypothetical protein
MKTRSEILQKLVKWYERAENCLDRSEVKKILKKAKKHARRLTEMDEDVPYM